MSKINSETNIPTLEEIKMDEKDIKRIDGKKEDKRQQNRGFYIAIAMSLAMVAAACFFAVKQPKDTPEPIITTTITQVTTVTDKQVASPQTSVPKTTTVVKQTTTPKITTTTATVTTTTSPPPAVAKPKTTFYPVSGEVLNTFSGGELVKSKTTGAWQTHNGTDFLAQPGDSVFAIKDGSVQSVEKDALWGITVTIDHGDGITAKYCGLNENVIAQAGEEVKGGFEIGTVGETSDIESLESSHIHLEITDGGRFVDPLIFLGNA